MTPTGATRPAGLNPGAGLAATASANRPLRAGLMILAVAALLSGMWAGLIRIGWALPPLQPPLPMLHGPLMVCGFLGTLIGLERAVGTGMK